jgi:integrase
MSTSTDTVRTIEDLPCWQCEDPRGADLRQKRLGHASPDVTLRIYAHLFRKDDSKAAAAINAALGG